MFLEAIGWFGIIFVILILYASIWMDLDRAERRRAELEGPPGA